MSRIHLTIDRLVLNGFDALEGKALSEALRVQLSQILSQHAQSAEWRSSYRTPFVKVGSMPLEGGTAGARKLGAQVAYAVGRGLKR